MNFLDVAIEAAKEAEKIILKYYDEGVRATLKSDQTPVTIADKKSEAIIIETIKKAFPSHGFLGEENQGNKSDSDYIWVIDPIDGTRNYLRKLPFFGTQIALVHKKEFIVGVSNAPAFHEMVHAEKGKGAYVNGQKIHVSTISQLSKAALSTGNLNYFVKTHQDHNMIRLINSVERDRGYGDFYQYTLLASNKVDIVVEADIKIWDVAALKVIVEEAGGKMTDIHGKELTLSSTSSIATNGILHQQVVEFFS